MSDVVHTYRGIRCVATQDVTPSGWLYIVEDHFNNLRCPTFCPITLPTNRIMEIMIELGSLEPNNLYDNDSLYDVYLRYCCESAD